MYQLVIVDTETKEVVLSVKTAGDMAGPRTRVYNDRQVIVCDGVDEAEALEKIDAYIAA